MTMDLRPLGLGELVDRSASLWRAHWLPLFRLFVGFQLAQYAVLRAYELASRAFFPMLRGGKATLDAFQSSTGQELLQQVLVAVPSTLVLVAALMLFTHALSTAGAALVVPIIQGEQRTVAQALARTAKQLGPTTGLLGLSVLWLLGWGLVAALPGIALAIGAALVPAQIAKPVLLALAVLWLAFATLFVLLGYVVRFATAGQVLAMEEVGAVGAWRRSQALSSGRVGPGLAGLVKVRLTLVISVVSLILLVVTLVASLPALYVQARYGNIFDPTAADPDAVPEALLVPAQLLQLVLGSLVAPLYAVAMGWFYVDMRMRREGLDLELKLGAAPK